MFHSPRTEQGEEGGITVRRCRAGHLHGRGEQGKGSWILAGQQYPLQQDTGAVLTSQVTGEPPRPKGSAMLTGGLGCSGTRPAMV